MPKGEGARSGAAGAPGQAWEGQEPSEGSRGAPCTVRGTCVAPQTWTGGRQREGAGRLEGHAEGQRTLSAGERPQS